MYAQDPKPLPNQPDPVVGASDRGGRPGGF